MKCTDLWSSIFKIEDSVAHELQILGWGRGECMESFLTVASKASLSHTNVLKVLFQSGAQGVDLCRSCFSCFILLKTLKWTEGEPACPRPQRKRISEKVEPTEYLPR